MDEDEICDDLMNEIKTILQLTKDNENNDIISILDSLLKALQEKGTTSEWIEIIRSNDFELADYFINLIISNNNSNNIIESSLQCLAFAANIYPSVWVDYTVDNEALCRLLLIVDSTINHIDVKLKNIDKTPKLDNVPYVGFDSRDVKDFNLEGYDEYTDEYKLKNKVSSSHGLVGLEDVSDVHAVILVRLLVLSQIFLKTIPFLEDLIVQYRFVLEDVDIVSSDIPDSVFEVLKLESEEKRELHVGIKTVQFLINIVEKLLFFTKDLPEDGFIQCIKAIVCLSKQFPERESLRSTELAETVAKIQLKGEYGANFSQGLLHALNEICLDLTNLNEMDGYFYINDVKILVDIIIRELANMSAPEINALDENESFRLEEIRTLYMRLASLLLAKSGWCSAGDSYRIQDVCDVLTAIIENDESCSDEFESKETAKAILETFIGYLDK